MLKTLVFAALTLTVLCAAEDQEVDSLRGLPAVMVRVSVVAPLSVGIGEADLKNAIELRLRSAGVKLATGLEIIGAPTMVVSVTAPRGDLGMYGISIALCQYVKPIRSDDTKSPTLLLATWQRFSDGMVSRGNPLIPTRQLAEKIVDDLVSDYRKANPQ
jgi:hypothetical protein